MNSVRFFIWIILTCSSFQVFSAVEYLSYTDTSSVKVSRKIASNNQTYLNNIDTINVAISSGLDRKVRMSVLTGDATLHTETSNVININDSIQIGGNTFYGVQLEAPIVSDGEYTLLIETLDFNNNVIATDSVGVVRDTVSPSYGVTENHSYGNHTGNPFQASGTWFWTDYVPHYNPNWLQLTDITDGSGIQSVELVSYIMEPTQSIYKTRLLEYNSQDKRARFTLNEDSAFWPRGDNGDTLFGFSFKVKDIAGNVAETPIQPIYYDTVEKGDLALVGVFNPNATTSMAGIQGYEEYKAGMTVYSNPVRTLYRVSNANYIDFALGGVGPVGQKQVIKNYADSGFTYVEFERPYNYYDNNVTRFTQRGKWMVSDTRYSLVLSPSAPKEPTRVGAPEYHYSDIGWASVRREFVQVDELDIRIKGLRTEVEPRTYVQEIHHEGYKCSIPVGETICEITFPENDFWLMKYGSYGHYPFKTVVKSADGQLYSSASYSAVEYNAKYSPEILSVSFNDTTKKLTVAINQYGAGWYFDKLRLGDVWLKDQEVGELLRVSGDNCLRQGTSYECQFDLNQLPSGNYAITVYAQEKHGLISSSETQVNYISDKEPPSLSWEYVDGSSVPDVVKDLRDIRLVISDQSATIIDELRIVGSAFDVDYLLGYSKLSSEDTKDQYSIELPKLFPTLQEGEGYRISAQVSDVYGNTTTDSIDISFIPENLIRLDTQTYLPISESLLTSDDEPIARVFSEEALVLEGGQLATGIQLAEVTIDANSPIQLTFRGNGLSLIHI